MTMSTQSCVVTYAGNGELTEFPYNFKIFNDTDLKGVVRDADGNETPLAAGTDFTVSGAGDSRGGSVIYPVSGAPLPEGASLTLHRELDFTQTLELVENDPFPAKLMEQEFDKAVMRDQQIKERIDRALAYSVAAPTEERLSCEEYVNAVQTAKSDAESASDETEAARTEASDAAARADVHAAEAALQSNRAEAAAVNAESLGGWWSTLSVNAAPSGDASFNVPGNLETIFTTGRSLKLTDSSNKTVCGYVSGAEYNGSDATAVSVTCSVPAILQNVEYGQAADNTPRPGPAAMMPEVTGPASGNEKACVDFSVVRIDGSEYTDEAEFFLKAVRDSDGTDISATFTLSKTSASTLRLTLPDVDMDTPAVLRFRATEGVLGCSEWSAPMPFTTKHVAMTADNAAVFNSIAADWPIQNADTACSKTVQQEENEADWTNLSAQVGIDATDANLRLSAIDSYNSGTLQCSDLRSALTGPWGMFEVGTDTGVVVTDEPVESSASVETTSTTDFWTGGPFTIGTDGSLVWFSGNSSAKCSFALTGDFIWEFTQASGTGSFNVGLLTADDYATYTGSNYYNDYIGLPNYWFLSIPDDISVVPSSRLNNGTATSLPATGSMVGVKVQIRRVSGVISFWKDVSGTMTKVGTYADEYTDVMYARCGACSECSISGMKFIKPGFSYTWTGLDQVPYSLASIGKVFKLPDCFVGTGGEVSVPQAGESIGVVLNDPLNSLVVTHPDSEIISVGTDLLLNGSQTVDVTAASETSQTGSGKTIVPILTGYTSGNFTVSASSEVSGRLAWNAFDGVVNGDTFWNCTTGNLPAFLNIACTTLRAIDAYTLISDNSRWPKSWELRGSNDGWVTYTTLDTQINETSWTDDVKRTFNLTEVAFYKEYRLHVADSNDASYLQISAMELLEGDYMQYTCTINPAASTTVTSAATAGTPLKVKELIVPEIELDVVEKNGTALTVKYPAALAGLFNVNQHNTVKINGSTAVDIDSVGIESDIVLNPVQYLENYSTTTAHSTGRTYLGGKILPNSVTLTKIGVSQGDSKSGTVGVWRLDSGTTYTLVSSVSGTIGGNATEPTLLTLGTPYEVSASGTYRIGLATASAFECCSSAASGAHGFVISGVQTGTQTFSDDPTNDMAVGYETGEPGKQTTLILATDPGAVSSAVVPSRFPASAEVPESVVRSDLSVGEETHDKLTITHSLHSISPEARSTALAVSRSDSETDQTCEATINLYTGA